jgi:hypothetical protein
MHPYIHHAHTETTLTHKVLYNLQHGETPGLQGKET